MLSSFMFRPHPTLPRPSGIPRHNRLTSSSHSALDLRQSTSFFSHCYALFCTAQSLNSFPFIFLRTLCAKHPGWGIPTSSATSVHSALKSTRAPSPASPFGTRCSTPATAPLSPFAAILDAASSISPAFATLTKNTRGGVPVSRRTSERPLSSLSFQLDQPVPSGSK